ncbi:MAG: phosphoribosylformylglycinamidine cyclo-ligase, partial [Balneolales bacterium]|nr:phosphoribosylformylglycinamidine cyclo-ligase [Balneolales bacterium]
DYTAWNRPAIFDLIQKTGNVPEEDMRLSFNLGVGLVIIAAPHMIEELAIWASKRETPLFIIGEVV